MAKQEIREPKQKRSIEKKQNILKAGYKLFCDKGYYKTNTAEIAQEAGVSTGIIYSYFQDKRDILIEVVRCYVSSLSEQLQPLLSAPVDKKNLPAVIEQLIDRAIASHTMNMEAHNEFWALSLLEKDILVLFRNFENTVLQKLYQLLSDAGYSETNLFEKVRISYGIVEQVCHDYIQRKPSRNELDVTKSLAVHAIITLLNDTI